MKSYLLTLIIGFILVFTEKSFSKITNNIILKVGNKIITNYEVRNKILSTLVLSNQEINQKNINKIKKNSIDLLIQKKIKEIELSKFNYKIEQSRIDDYLKLVSSNSTESFKKNFKNNRINFDLFLEEIKIQFKWQQHIVNTYSSKIEINQEEVEKEMKKILENQQSLLEYRLSEIEISINNDVNDKEKISDLINLISQIGFEKAALNFSISTTAELKGDLGWINSKSLSKDIFNLVNSLKVGEISEPIIKPGSATILKIVDKKKLDINNLDVKKLRLNLTNAKKNELFNLYSQSLLSKLKNTTLIEYINE